MSTQKLRVKSLSGQAKEAILQYIEEMDLKTDNKLPREEALAEMLGVSRITIRQALNDLAAEGKGYICQCGFSQYQGHVQSLYGIDADDQKERVCSFRQTFKYSKSKTGGRNLFSSSDAAGRTAGSGRKAVSGR